MSEVSYSVVSDSEETRQMLVFPTRKPYNREDEILPDPSAALPSDGGNEPLLGTWVAAEKCPGEPSEAACVPGLTQHLAVPPHSSGAPGPPA